MRRCRIGLFMILAIFLPGAGTPAPDKTKREPGPFDDKLLEIAKTYTKYGRVDDEFRVAPLACDVPRNPKAAFARFSESKDDGTHGKKLYSLFVKEKHLYLRMEKDKPQPVGQFLVKQSWKAEEVTDPDEKPKVVVAEFKATAKEGKQASPRSGHLDHFVPYAEKDGKLYHAAEQADLFIMFKMDPKTKDTDKGWVYGTVTSDGKTVTSAGQVKSCMKCHQDAKHDRLFGLPKK